MATTRSLASLSGLVALCALGCGPVPIGFDITQPISEQTITGNLVANTAGQALPAGSIAPMAITVDLSSESRTRNIPIGRVLLKAFSLNVTATAQPAGDTDDFAFIRTATMYIECANSCALPRIAVATATGSAVASLVFTPTPGVNLKPYFDAGARIVLEADAIPPPDDTSFNGTVTIRIEPI
ncbi:MAG: hypothetical protein Q8Q09_19890 [Deltaproteobacteria bacterium]|nr:hypothetical protein [Deltaproteobacteria bacterium]